MGGASPPPCLFPDWRKYMSESHFRIKNEFFRVPEFIDFYKKRKSLVYFFLRAAIIRKSKFVEQSFHPAFYTYREHFLKKQLVSRYSQKNMELYLGTSQSAISRYLKELEEDGFIKKIVRPTRKTKILYYQFGTYEGDYGKDTYKEIIWLDEFFSKKYDDARKLTAEKNTREGQIALMKFFDNWIDYSLNISKTTSPEEIDDLLIIWNEKKTTENYAI
jgi:DNA-binding HxlR family transcriptional regulator